MQAKPVDFDLPLLAALPSGGDMSQVAISTVAIRWAGYGGSLQLVWTGTPTGTLAVLVSNDFQDGGPLANGTWTDISALLAPPIVQPAGAAGNAFVDLEKLRAGYVRVTYTRAGGAGTLKCWRQQEER